MSHQQEPSDSMFDGASRLQQRLAPRACASCEGAGRSPLSAGRAPAPGRFASQGALLRSRSDLSAFHGLAPGALDRPAAPLAAGLSRQRHDSTVLRRLAGRDGMDPSMPTAGS